MIDRLLRSADFERVLQTRDLARTAHFAVHHVAAVPRPPARAAKRTGVAKLSTAVDEPVEMSVDDLLRAGPEPRRAKGTLWMGTVVPKRHARRAVTRNLLKRQIRSVAVERQHELPGGLWVVRLRAPIEHTFVSAASTLLRDAVRGELERALEAAVRALRPARP
jgi:ribonuclease P protein component